MAKFFSVRITGLDGIRKDVYRVKQSLKQPINNGLTMMGDVMTTSLQRHIREDWYNNEWKPKKYKRRTDDNSLGTPMGDRSNIHATVSDRSLLFEYEPNTANAENEEWDDHSPDLLIYRIENNDKWKYDPDNAPERHFWSNFLNEMKASKSLMSAFQSGFGSPESVTLRLEGGSKDILWMAGEGEIEPDGVAWEDNAFSTFGDSYYDDTYDTSGDEIDF